jgi:transcriptional regulator GlxA family with amidase domain
MRIAIVTLDGFNEIDSFVAQHILCRVREPKWEVLIACPNETATSMNGVTVHAQMRLHDLPTADAVIIGSGSRTLEFASDAALLLAKLGLLDGIPACTDLTTKPWVIEAGVEILDQPFFASDRIATAGGCLSGQYLAAWMISSLVGEDAARDALHYVAPVGEKDEYVQRALANIRPFVFART